MLKTTSLLERGWHYRTALGAAENISATNYRGHVIVRSRPVCVWYLIMTTILSSGQFYLERHFAKGALRTQPLTPLQRLRADIRGILSKFRTHP